MKNKLVILFTICLLSKSYLFAKEFYDFEEPKSQEEALFVRRIIEFWEEKEYELAKAQIRDFLIAFPENTYRDKLLAIAGDLSMKDKEYALATSYYSDIRDKGLRKKVLLNRLECMRNLEWYLTLAEDCEENLETFAEFDPQKHRQITYLLADALYNLTLRSPDDSFNHHTHAEKAIERFESLLKTNYALDVMQPLAHVYSLMGEHRKASDLFITLAQKKPDLKDEMLFQAATLQLEFDKELAVQTFGQVYHLGKKRAPDAAYNRMILLFEMDHYADIILAKDQLLEHISNEKHPIVHFFLGRSHYHLEDYKRAILELEKFVTENSSYEDEIQNAYATILDSAKHLEDLVVYNEYLGKFETSYPGGESIASAYKERALLHKKTGKYKLSKRDFRHVIENYPDYSNKEALLYEFAHLLYLTEDWKESRDISKRFLDEFSESPYASSGWRLLIHASIASAQNDSAYKQELVGDLDRVLDQKDLLKENERVDYIYLMAKTNYEIEKYDATIDILIDLLKRNLTPSLLSNSYLLMANAYKKGTQNHGLYCAYAEKALQENPNMEKKEQLHLALFNSYLRLYAETSSKNSLEKAADHLFIVQELGIPIKKKNRDWLIAFYHNNVKNYLEANWKSDIHDKTNMKDQAERALALLKNPQDPLLEDQEVEENAIKLSDIYGFMRNHKMQAKTLLSLRKKYTKNPEGNWEQKTLTQFKLAKAFLNLNKKKKALTIFDQIVADSKSLQNYISAYSSLQSARIRFALLDKNFLKPDNAELIKILTQLKTLTLQKTFENEPVYLESAYDYIDAQCFLLEEKEGDEKRIYLLEKCIDHFLSDEDVLSKEYQIHRGHFPEKEKVFLAYIDLFDLDSYVTKASLAKAKGEKSDAKEHLIAAKELFEELKVTCPTQYFYKRLQQIEERLNALSISIEQFE